MRYQMMKMRQEEMRRARMMESRFFLRLIFMIRLFSTGNRSAIGHWINIHGVINIHVLEDVNHELIL